MFNIYYGIYNLREKVLIKGYGMVLLRNVSPTNFQRSIFEQVITFRKNVIF